MFCNLKVETLTFSNYHKMGGNTKAECSGAEELPIDNSFSVFLQLGRRSSDVSYLTGISNDYLICSVKNWNGLGLWTYYNLWSWWLNQIHGYKFILNHTGIGLHTFLVWEGIIRAIYVDTMFTKIQTHFSFWATLSTFVQTEALESRTQQIEGINSNPLHQTQSKYIIKEEKDKG